MGSQGMARAMGGQGTVLSLVAIIEDSDRSGGGGDIRPLFQGLERQRRRLKERS